MVTWQDLQMVGDSEIERMQFIRSAISKYQSDDMYKTAVVADLYDRRRNPDIEGYTKMLYTVTGKMVPDRYSSDYKIGRGFFPYFITQEVQYLLGNGVNWENSETSEKLGTKMAEFDTRLQQLAHDALTGACSYGFWNYDHVDAFTAREFVPILDEETGALRSGIRWWQIDSGKPFRATLYEEDGYTEYIWHRRDGHGNFSEDGEVLRNKTAYIVSVTGTDVDEDKIYHGENYPTFPIVPFWGNKKHQSELVGIREQIFAYDMIMSGFCNSVEDASYVYWAIHNAPGMDDQDLAEFLQRVKSIHVAQTQDGGASAEPHQLDTPYQSRETLLERMEKNLFKDAMAFDPEKIAGGAATATQIRAAYENLEMKCNDFEYCVIEFVNGILELAGIEDNPTFTRSKNVNVSEEIQTIMQAATALDDEYITKKILTLLGDGDMADEVIARKIDDEVTIQRGLNTFTQTTEREGEVNG